jgi:hypothetical protein
MSAKLTREDSDRSSSPSRGRDDRPRGAASTESDWQYDVDTRLLLLVKYPSGDVSTEVATAVPHAYHGMVIPNVIISDRAQIPAQTQAIEAASATWCALPGACSLPWPLQPLVPWRLRRHQLKMMNGELWTGSTVRDCFFLWTVWFLITALDPTQVHTALA